MASSFVDPPRSSQTQDHKPRSSHSVVASQRTAPNAISAIELAQLESDALSSAEHIETPSGSNATLSHYQSSDFSDLDDDPFFGANFNIVHPATPSFLDDAVDWGQSEPNISANGTFLLEPHNDHHVDEASYPLTPTHTTSLHTASPTSNPKELVITETSEVITSTVSPQQLHTSFKPNPVPFDPAITPSHSGSSNRTSEDGSASAAVTMHPQSPRVTISMWDKDDAPIHTVERTLDDSPRTVRGGIQSAGDLIYAAGEQESAITQHGDSLDRWQQEPNVRRAGLEPAVRPADQVLSINEIMSRRRTDERNQDVGRWLSDNQDDASATLEKSPEEIQAIDRPQDVDDGIPLGYFTQNRYVPGQTYFEGTGGEITDVDREIISSTRNWADAPMIHGIQETEPGRFQPESSQAAIARFERMCRDNDSIISRSATWGTRRRSLPSIIDVEGVISGNFLKKLSLSRGSGEKTVRPGNFLRDLRGLVRRTSQSQTRKRSRSRSRGRSIGGQDDVSFEGEAGQQNLKRESTPHLSPPLGSSPVSGRRPTPSLNTTLASMGQNLASMWTGHSRSGSVSGPSPMASPRASLSSLSVRNSIRRPRSKSDLPKPTGGAAGLESTSSLVAMWRQSGGPPVAPVASVSHVQVADDDDDDDDDDLYDEDMKANSNIIDDIAPNFAGFQRHVLTLNPGLETAAHGYLVDRIAHQQIVRYKHLLSAKVKHLGLGANCPCGSLCMALGGTASVIDQRGDPRGLDPLSIEIDDGDDDMPTEGAISQESFPPGIPLPPTQYLPAEFECQLCFQRKKLHKPSDWTKHVHEDVQPFTCTWDKCRDPKIFKRKADWVRHENEGHRHLEWWTCDVDDCRHTCYRRDNFLQHLVREHKFLEPKIKSKSAIKRAGGMDPTWQKVEQCHIETSARPQDEPCRFCGRAFPTWKKLTVHLAKHMEQITLPVLRLVASKAKELAADTIISPIQDLPSQRLQSPNAILPPSSGQSGVDQHFQTPLPQQSLQSNYNQQDLAFQSPNSFMYNVIPGQFHQQQMYPQQFENTGQTLNQPNMNAGPMNQHMNPGLAPGQHSGAYLQSNGNFMGGTEADEEPFPQMTLNALGLQNMGDDQVGSHLGGQVVFDPIMDPSSVNGSPFSGHESLSVDFQSAHLDESNKARHQQQQQQQQQPQWGERPLFM